MKGNIDVKIFEPKKLCVDSMGEKLRMSCLAGRQSKGFSGGRGWDKGAETLATPRNHNFGNFSGET